MTDSNSVSGVIRTNLDSFYDWLRTFARDLMRRERVGHTLEATALANEVLTRLCQWQGDLSGEDDAARQKSLRLLAGAIARQVLVDHARQRMRLKRGGNLQRVSLEQVDRELKSEHEILELERALREFEDLFPEEARLVQLRYFGGATVAEAADQAERP